MSRNNNNNRGKSKHSKSPLKSKVLHFFKSNPKKRVSAKQLHKKLKLKVSVSEVQNTFHKLEKQGLLYNIAENKFRLDRFIVTDEERETHEGMVDLIRSGSAYIIVDGMEEDIYVPSKHLGFALDKDIVKVEITRKAGKNKKKAEGKVVKIIKRSNNQFLGSLNVHKGQGVVHINNSKTAFDIQITTKDLNDGQDGDIVIVELVENGQDPKKLWGRVSSNLGEMSANDLEMNSILINAGFNIEFPEEVKRESEAISTEITGSEIENRRDIRGVLTFTIDPHDAKDFDDAISYEVLDNGSTRIGVHIADVSHYVRPGTELDKEAFFRSTSVYLVDRVCPMLPEKLSNELCSLRPNEDKLCYSAIFDMDDALKIKNVWIGRTVIHSDRRFTYEDAQEIIDAGEGDHADVLIRLNEIAKTYRKRRFKNGAINFETDEVRFRIGEDGEPLSVYIKDRMDTHMLVEEFMLMANRSVATYMTKLDKKKPVPFVYRVHDEPDPDKLADFAVFAASLGINLNVETPQNVAKSLNSLAKKTEENDTLKMLQPLAIRTMAKAIYTTDNIGHYGLAFDNYTHFTSPIRRYSDVLVHRIVDMNLDKITRVSEEELEAKCKHISAQEKKAVDAERESIKYKQVEYMASQIGETFEGVISGMIERGIFIELLESKAEGMISFEQIGDHFENENAFSVVGKKTGTSFKMGDKIMVTLREADLDKRRLEFDIADVEAKKDAWD